MDPESCRRREDKEKETRVLVRMVLVERTVSGRRRVMTGFSQILKLDTDVKCD